MKERSKAILRAYICLLACAGALAAGVFPVKEVLLPALVSGFASIAFLSSTRARAVFGFVYCASFFFSMLVRHFHFANGVFQDSASVWLGANALFLVLGVATILVLELPIKRN